MKIKTGRFGEIEVGDGDIIVMKGSILGFGHLKRFILLIQDEHTPLCWLQAVDDPAVAFVVVNPRVVKPDYNPVVPEADLEFLDIRNKDDAALLSIVTVRMQPFGVTANIKAPILINAVNKMAKQVVLDDPEYPIQHNVLGNEGAFTAERDCSCPDPRLSIATALSI